MPQARRLLALPCRVVEYIADHVAVMQAGRIVEQGAGEAVLQHPRHEYTRALLAVVPRLAVLA